MPSDTFPFMTISRASDATAARTSWGKADVHAWDPRRLEAVPLTHTRRVRVEVPRNRYREAARQRRGHPSDVALQHEHRRGRTPRWIILFGPFGGNTIDQVQ